MPKGRLWIVLGVAVLAAVAVVAFVADGHRAPGTPKQQLRSWATTVNLGQDVGTLQDDAAAVAKAVKEHKGTGVIHTICSSMEIDAQTYNDNLPSPDTAVTQLLAGAYSDAYDAAEACYHAGATDPALMKKSVAASAKARRAFEKALARVAQVTGYSVPTTTTTVVGTTSTALF